MKNTILPLMPAILALLLSATVPANAQWSNAKPLPSPRAYSASAVLHGKLYVFGGTLSDASDGLTRVVEMYDPATDTWTTKDSLPEPIRAASAQTINGKIYLVGGWGPAGSLNTLYVYDPDKGIYTQKAPMPTARGHHSTAVVDGMLYALGGTPNYPIRTNRVEMYDPALDRWVTKKPMLNARSAFPCEVVDGKIYAIGGSTHVTIEELKILEVYDPATDTWTLGKQLPQPRGFSYSGTWNKQIYLFSGFDGFDILQTVIKYDPATDNWEQVGTMPEYKAACPSAVIDGCIYGIGGALIPFYFNLPGPKVSETVLKYCLAITVSISGEQHLEAFLVYPNPAADLFHLQLKGRPDHFLFVELYNLSGQKVWTEAVDFKSGASEMTFSCRGLPKGVYLIRVSGTLGSSTQKVILE